MLHAIVVVLKGSCQDSGGRHGGVLAAWPPTPPPSAAPWGQNASFQRVHFSGVAYIKVTVNEVTHRYNCDNQCGYLISVR